MTLMLPSWNWPMTPNFSANFQPDLLGGAVTLTSDSDQVLKNDPLLPVRQSRPRLDAQSGCPEQ